MDQIIEQILADVVERAIAEVHARKVPVYTFGFYHDHESAAVSICVDTEKKSEASVATQNDWSMNHFRQKVVNGDMESAALFNANAGRNLSLGDFALVNVARTDLPDAHVPVDFYETMVKIVMAREAHILALAQDPRRLIFCCSGPDDEVQYLWTAKQGK